MGKKWGYILGIITLLTIIAANYLIFIWVPAEKVMGIVQKIFYFHVAAAWVGFLAFFIVFISSIKYLLTFNEKWDWYSAASAEIGFVFMSIVLATGSIWGRAFWGHWWTWDPRLTTSLILWFIYAAYLLLRSGITLEGRRARYSAVLGIIGFIDVPIVWFSVRWWRTVHPNLMESGKMAITTKMSITLSLSVMAFTLLYAFLLPRVVKLYQLDCTIQKTKDVIIRNL
ncbi:MAG: cytochrome C assembly protein [Clostridiaceae bacterium BRH_c20a]|nr:MAG: cytochrome C assembly protein [Clostridiaceae bacterium BRH_c20a]